MTWENSPDCGINPLPYGISLLKVGYWVELNWKELIWINQTNYMDEYIFMLCGLNPLRLFSVWVPSFSIQPKLGPQCPSSVTCPCALCLKVCSSFCALYSQTRSCPKPWHLSLASTLLVPIRPRPSPDSAPTTVSSSATPDHLPTRAAPQILLMSCLKDITLLCCMLRCTYDQIRPFLNLHLSSFIPQAEIQTFASHTDSIYIIYYKHYNWCKFYFLKNEVTFK